MRHYIEPVDCDGNVLSVGDNVQLVLITDHLLRDLPSEDRQAINAQLGKTFKLLKFDDYSFAEIDFEYTDLKSETRFHTIWIEPFCLKKI